MTTTDITTLLRSVKLPVMPEVAHALIRTLKDDDADMGDVRRIIDKDPALTATLLRMANSAMFGLSRKVTTLDSALNVVGMSQVRARALGICLANAVRLPDSMSRMDFWRYCMVCAGYAKLLAGWAQTDEQQAWLTAMMLRLGEALIGQVRPGDLASIGLQPCAPGERWLRERQILGFDEGQITAAMAGRWDFPDEVVQALEQACLPVTNPRTSKLAKVVSLAAWLAEHADDLATLQACASALPPKLLSSLNIAPEKLLAGLPDPATFADVSSLLN
ncbi:MAG: HDOD domain-containing protein [Rhodoferax sp.]|nr:HDOD domain-containing protein [Rhodoferax sp.]